MDTVGAIQEFVQGGTDTRFQEAASVLAIVRLSVLVETLKAFDEWDVAALIQQLANGFNEFTYDDVDTVTDKDAPYDEHGYDEHDHSKNYPPPLDLSDIPF